ncbi:helix-turn-helix transcriptional regulator [Chryseobacterium sp. G0240]|uniref:LexA family transcriptional regulator n=1 Tax=Chryseobacterium sp. G0240 TaxID=2487066 RepID=UPI000F4528DF|nr:S24 family peptidase [Chryseobacterium sp. G0240]ROH98375.1 helix-turn-helix transcriptional regulator [Chryseobacterium sp. G0240]
MDKSLILNLIKLHYKFKTDSDFAKFLDISPQMLANWKTRNTIDYDLIYTKCVDIDANWLLTGKGDMIRPEYNSIIARESKSLNSENNIPLVNVNAIGGFGNNAFSIDSKDVKEYYVIPKFKNKRVDFMIEVEGDSMYDKYSPGDIVACTIIKESSFLQWYKVHVIATREQGIIIKRLEPGETSDYLTMISDNQRYRPFTVPKSEITGIALVVGMIRLE